MVSLVLVTLYAYFSLDLMPLFITSSTDTKCQMMSLAFSTPLLWHLLMPKYLQNCTGSCRCRRYSSDHCDSFIHLWVSLPTLSLCLDGHSPQSGSILEMISVISSGVTSGICSSAPCTHSPLILEKSLLWFWDTLAWLYDFVFFYEKLMITNYDKCSQTGNPVLEIDCSPARQENIEYLHILCWKSHLFKDYSFAKWIFLHFNLYVSLNVKNLPLMLQTKECKIGTRNLPFTPS